MSDMDIFASRLVLFFSGVLMIGWVVIAFSVTKEAGREFVLNKFAVVLIVLGILFVSPAVIAIFTAALKGLI
jgi:uncharacterized membrane protein YhdT